MAGTLLLSTRLLLVAAIAVISVALNLFPTNVVGVTNFVHTYGDGGEGGNYQAKCGSCQNIINVRFVHIYGDGECSNGAEIRIDYQAKCGSCYNIDEYPSFKFFGDPTGILVYDGWGCRGEASALTTSDTNWCFHGTNEKDGVSFFVICDEPPAATDMK